METTQNSGGQVIYGQQGGFGAATTKAMAKGDPFQIHGYWQQTSEPILSIEGGKEIIEGFKNLDFFVNVDMYMTPSGELADIILPAAHPNEVDRVEWAHSGHGYPTSHTYLVRQPFHEPLGEDVYKRHPLRILSKGEGVPLACSRRSRERSGGEGRWKWGLDR